MLTGVDLRHTASNRNFGLVLGPDGGRLERIPLLVCDLCRQRDYADIFAAAGLSAPGSMGFSPLGLAGLSA